MIKVPEVAQVEVAQVEVAQVEVAQVEVTQVEESQVRKYKFFRNAWTHGVQVQYPIPTLTYLLLLGQLYYSTSTTTTCILRSFLAGVLGTLLPQNHLNLPSLQIY